MRMRTRRLVIDGLSPDRVAELRYFCRQYPAKKAALGAMRGGFNAFGQDGQPKSRGRISDSTARRAMRALDSKERRDVEMIESAAHEACRGSRAVYSCLMRNVTQGISVTNLAIPMGVNQFYALRRHFFVILDGKQNDR